MRDGSIQLHIIAQEAPPRNLEYGVSRSLYTGSWEGELDFLHGNMLGGGETLGLVVRRGAKDPEPSVRLRFQDDNFGLEGGYNIELFNDYVAVDGLASTEAASNLIDSPAAGIGFNRDDSGKSGIDKIIESSFDHEALISRKGITIRLRDPSFVPVVKRSSVASSLERTSSRTGKHEEIGSVTLDLGPFQREFPLQARANLLTSYTIGTRLSENGMNTVHRNFLPYSSAAATSRQIIPISTGAGNEHRPVELAFQHSIMTSSCNLPRHEANAAGIAARVRGYPLHSNGPINRYVVGTAELRVPIPLPLEKVTQDANVVFFGDWMYGERGSTMSSSNASFRRASIGIGLRKSVQGLPLKYDICVTDNKKIGGFFSLGLDFDV
jgi:outer membrane protein assembly factor BamA